MKTGFSIAVVERDTGLSKDVLRVWERRYGFPIPERDANGERSYPPEQVARLRLIRRLMDQGHRPGKLLLTPPEELAQLAPRREPVAAAEAVGVAEADLESLLARIRAHDAAGFQEAMQQRLARQGLQRFVQDTVAPLTAGVGRAWEQGRLEVFEEHLFTELVKRLLRQAVAALPGNRREPRVLLTSVPDEQHALGLLMVESLLALEGADCIPLGPQVPVVDIARAAVAHRADVVALSFSSAYGPRQIPGLLSQLRALLPGAVALWVGGAGVSRVADVEGVQRLHTLGDAVAALQVWRGAHA
jgi:MerR family transcriptional regulator, light-induced transcriptional regulator